MLAALSIRDVVLIDRLELSFGPGLSVLTGETGAGKSILLDALGLALGDRADARLVREGAERALVSATFDLPADHPAFTILRQQDLPDDGLVIRRSLTPDGRSRVFVNDAPASVALLRQLGEALVEIHGQHEQRGLLDPSTHRLSLDAFGQLSAQSAATADAWRAWQRVREERSTAAARVEQARRDEAALRDALAELDRLAPQPGEEAGLAETRAALMNRERIAEALQTAQSELSAGRGVDAALRSASRALERAAEKAAGLFDEAIAALDRAAIEVGEAVTALDAAASRMDGATARLEAVEERLFALRAAARRHGVEADALIAVHEGLRTQLSALEDETGVLDRLGRAETAAREAYVAAAGALGVARRKAARALDQAIAGELPPLRLDRARFRTSVEELPDTGWGPAGADRVMFEVATNPGAAFGPLSRIASGGELSRFMLALEVVLAGAGPATTLVFDEVDAGVGGAVAAAVGARLAKLAQSVQILVVTHSPQVAARGDRHWQVVKHERGGRALTEVSELDAGSRREEIARMLSGAEVTDAARAAAASLMARVEA